MPERLIQTIVQAQKEHQVDFSHIIITPPWYDGEHLTEDEANAQLGKQEFQERIESRLKEVISQEINDKSALPQISITNGVKYTLEYVFFSLFNSYSLIIFNLKIMLPFL